MQDHRRDLLVSLVPRKRSKFVKCWSKIAAKRAKLTEQTQV